MGTARQKYYGRGARSRAAKQEKPPTRTAIKANKQNECQRLSLFNQKGDKFILSHQDADTGLDFERWEFKNLEEALAKAEEEQDLVEYGLRFKLKKRGNKW